jgi:hypothetical protein
MDSNPDCLFIKALILTAVVAKVRERLAVRKRVTQKCNMGRNILKKLNR